jgi:hypothetical protein
MVYHIKPDPMEGSILFPLNKLAKIYPELTKKPMEKYSWRPELLSRKIPGLNVLWNDVLHFSTLHPKYTFQSLRDIKGPVGRTIEIIHVPIELLEPRNCVYFLGSDKVRESLSEMHLEEIRKFIPSEYQEANEVSRDQIAKWKENLQKSEPMLLFSRTRHLLYAGDLDIGGLTIESLEI